VNALPEYLEYGPRATFPPAFLATGGRFVGLVLDGDVQRIEPFCDALNKTVEGRVNYTPLGSYVVMMVGEFARQSSLAKEFINRGYASETALVFWVPLLATDARETRLCLAAPYVFVDNELSLLCGREDYGYAKSLAKFYPANGLGPNVTVKAFGGDFVPGSMADWCTVLNITALGGAVVQTPWDTPQKVAAELVGTAAAGEAILKWVVKLVEELVEKKARQVFLKQFRDAECAGAACYRRVVESPVAFTEPSVRVLLRPWYVDVTPLSSHPITADLGVESQAAPLAFEIKMNMLVCPGKVV